MRFGLLAIMLAASVPASPPLWAQVSVERAVANASARTADNVALDASRKPAELLKFFGLERGDQVLDLFGGNGYWAEIIAPVIGPRGKVTVWQPAQFYNEERRTSFIEGAGRNRNVQLISSPMEAPDLPANSYDFALINLDYHDIYWENAQRGIPRMEPQAWLQRLLAAMKPGAIVGVVDHVAAAGAEPRESVEKLHRIDPAIIRADFEKAGFVLEGQSDMLRNAADDHSLSVFDKAIRGKTDRVIFKFRKPSAAR